MGRKKYFILGIALITILIASLLGYGVYLNERGENQITERMENLRIPLVGERAQVREISPITKMDLVNLYPVEMTDVVSLESGRITSVLVEKNSHVKTGDPLFTLVDEDIPLKIRQADSDILQAEAALIKAENSFHRYEQLREVEAVSIRSPERLDMLLPITTPMGWMGLIAITLLLFSVLLWSIFGSFTVSADGMGMLMDSGGVVNVTHDTGGRIAHYYVREGQAVKKGTRIAYLRQAGQAADVNMAQYGTQLGENMRDTAQRAYQYKYKMYQQEISQDVIAEHDGVVDQLLVQEGSYVPGGTPIATLRRTQKRDDLKGVLYVPVEKGKRIQPGQTVQLVPAGVDVQESGSLIGLVRKVSDYPVSLRGMEEELGNAQMAQFIFQQEGAVMEVAFDLVKEADPGGLIFLLLAPAAAAHAVLPSALCR